MTSPTGNGTNVLLVVVDQWRRDTLGCAGHPAVRTPHLDRWAADGVRFERAYAATPTCIPARAALLTGLSQENHGFVGYDESVAWRYPTTLAGTFADAGYHTHCAGKMHVKPTRNLMGFHDVALHDGYLHHTRKSGEPLDRHDDFLPDLRRATGDPRADDVAAGVGCNGYAVAPWPYDAKLHPTAWVTDRAVDFISRRRDPSRPFFLKVSYHRPHPPLDPPAWWLESYHEATLPPTVGDWASDLQPAAGTSPESPVPTDPAQISLARRAYWAQCSFIDNQLNRLTMALVEAGVERDTHVLFVSDHGEMLYDHGQIGKAVPFEASAGIPCLLRPAPSQQHERGVVDNRLVELRDVLATCCHLTGIDPPATDGLPMLGDARREVLHGEHARGTWSHHFLTDGRQKFIWWAATGNVQLFDLANDPEETHDLAAERPDEMREWRQRLAEVLADRPEGFVADGDLIAGREYKAALPWAGAGRGN
jgi:arylsulfatase A-like enzyme